MDPKNRDNHLHRSLLESKEDKITDDGLKSLVPMYVHGKKPGEDHKCGTCRFRVLTGDPSSAGCTIVYGDIDLKNGTCAFWSPGPPSTSNQIHPSRMSKSLSWYTEVEGVINCSSCSFYEDSYCKLWDGKVKPQDCCMSWENLNIEKDIKED